MAQEQDAKYPTPEHRSVSAPPEEDAKMDQVLKTALTFADKTRHQPAVTYLVRAAERFNDRMGNQFGAAITYFSFLSITPVLIVSFIAAGFILASRPALLQDIFSEILPNVGDPALAPMLKNTISTAVQQCTTVGLVGLGIVPYSDINWIGDLREATHAQPWDI